MIDILGATLPFVVGMLLSPVPVIATLLVLASPSGRAGGVAYAVGRFVGVALVAVVVSLLADVITIESESSAAASILRVVLGLVLVGLAARKLAGRIRGDRDSAMPKWMSSIEGMSPRGTAGTGFALAVANPKELAFNAGAGLTVGAAGLAPAPTIGAALVYAVVACLTVFVPVALFLASPERVGGVLSRTRTWLVANNDVIMSVLFLVIGSVLIGDGVNQL